MDARRTIGVPVAILILSLACLGCYVKRPLVLSNTTTGRSSATDLGFLQPKITSRTEVEQRLAWAIVLSDERVILVRWISSDRIWTSFGGYGGSQPPNSRSWKSTNVLMEFDAQKILTAYRIFPDSAFVQEVKELASPEGSQRPDPVQVTAVHHSGRYTLLLSQHLVEFQADVGGPGFRAPVKDLVLLRTVSPRGGRCYTETCEEAGETQRRFVECKFEFRTRTPMGKTVELWMSPGDLLLLVKHIQRTHPTALSGPKQ